MNEDKEKTVTVIYYSDESLELLHSVCTCPLDELGRVTLDEAFKVGKSIIAICDGEVDILNKTGERILPHDSVE